MLAQPLYMDIKTSTAVRNQSHDFINHKGIVDPFGLSQNQVK